MCCPRLSIIGRTSENTAYLAIRLTYVWKLTNSLRPDIDIARREVAERQHIPTERPVNVRTWLMLINVL